jgi:hypothetical protein
VLVDLPGPKIRTGLVAATPWNWSPARSSCLTATDDGMGDVHHVATTLPELAQWARRGDEVYLADGAIVLRVLESLGSDVRTEIVRGGTLRSRKGMHLPRAEAHVEPFTDRDALALEMAIAAKVDFLGLSFVRRAEDVERVRAMLPKRGVDRRWCRRSRPRRPSTTSRESSSRRRGDGRARRPRHPDAGATRAAAPEGDHPFVQHGRQAGDHRHADARVDDALALADARRGE